ncbi:MAG: hypothetical protein K6F61_10885 [Clostridiales bacterium]|nr:hypothetical protein [Clostridiales bacterium]
MKKNRKANNEGISLRVVHIAMVVCAVIISLLLVFSTYQSSNVFTALNKATGNYIVRQAAAHELMEASDYLTEMVQRFTLEGETQYLDNYFEEAFTSKRREAAITSMSESEAESVLVEQLQKAMDESTSLMYREYYAMKLVIEAKEIRNYPETLRAIELKDEDTFRSADDKMELAQEMVLGTEYYSRKEIIRTNLKASLQTLDKLMNTTRQNTTAELNKELTIVRVVIIVLTLVILFLIYLTARLGTMPLINAQKQAEAGEPISVTGAKEFRYMAKHYNKMHEKLYGNKEDAR